MSPYLRRSLALVVSLIALRSICVDAQLPSKTTTVRFDPQVLSQSGKTIGCGIIALGLASPDYASVTVLMVRNEAGIISIGKFATGRVRSLNPARYTTKQIRGATISWGDQIITAQGGGFEDGVYIAQLDEAKAPNLLNAWIAGTPFTATLTIGSDPFDAIFDMTGRVSDQTRHRYAACVKNFLSTGAAVRKR